MVSPVASIFIPARQSQVRWTSRVASTVPSSTLSPDMDSSRELLTSEKLLPEVILLIVCNSFDGEGALVWP